MGVCTLRPEPTLPNVLQLLADKEAEQAHADEVRAYLEQKAKQEGALTAVRTKIEKEFGRGTR